MDRDAEASNEAMGDAGGADSGGDSGREPDAWVKPEDRPCMDGDQGSDYPWVRATTVGADESRTDFCDADGNLIDHECEVIELADSVCGCAGECTCGAQVTGRIVELPYDCEGDCIDGACIGWCPDGGDSLSITLGASLGTRR